MTIKTFLAALAIAFAATFSASAQTADSTEVQTPLNVKNMSKAERKRLQQQVDSMQFDQALQAMRDSAFTLEANHVVFKRGERVFVQSNTNFVSVNKRNATVQVAFNVPMAGPNGMGGVTVEGMLTNYQFTSDKRGNQFLTFTVQGRGISAQIMITLTAGCNQATLTVLPNFHSGRFTFEGNIWPIDQSFVVRGTVL